ncbi:MAG: hypothetical protein EPO19_08560 [Betaproteobacteria bacterium]|nr:MAG: hypothetical protein EPO19_08560 [Betaproteobacteria bacterium]
MKKALAVLIASVFVAGSALAQAPAAPVAGAVPATTVAVGGMTAGMIAATVAIVAVAIAASQNDSTAAASTTTTTTTTK